MAFTTINNPSDYFNTLLYTGTGSAQSLTGVGFQPDLVWLKDRTTGTTDHLVQDVIRGATYNLRTNTTNAQDLSTGNVTSFDSDGFSLGTGGYANASGDNFVSWNWLADNTSGSSNTDGSVTSTVSANTTSGFSIVKYTATGSVSTIGHGLGEVPKLIIVKNLAQAIDWVSYHSALGATKNIRLNTTDPVDTSSSIWNDTAPTSSVFTVGTSALSNGTGNDLIAYCFAEKQGFSKFGSYVGNGSSTSGAFIYLGFRPAFVLLKNTTTLGYSWPITDNKRETSNDGANSVIWANRDYAEDTNTYDMNLLSNGFKINSTSNNFNKNGDTYIYIAFAEQSLVTSNGLPSNAR